MTNIQGAVTVVTGASRGIGVHIARALGQRGAKLVLAARSETELMTVRDQLAAEGMTVTAVRADVASADDRAALVAHAEREFGPVDILVNNAGVEISGAFTEIEAAGLRQILDINLHAPMELTRLVLPGMVARERGHILNVSSAAGKLGPPFIAAYAASKHGLVGFSASLRSELDRSGVGVSVICPAFVTDTGMYDRWAQQGVKAPKITGVAKLDKVVRASVKAIEKNRAEILINTPPIRPLVVLGSAAPGIVPKLFRVFGYRRVLEEAANLPGESKSTS
jgi:short-subunit dehydrogenase